MLKLLVLLSAVVPFLSGCNSGADQFVLQSGSTLDNYPAAAIYRGDIQSSDGMGNGMIYTKFDINGAAQIYFSLGSGESSSLAMSSGFLKLNAPTCYIAQSTLTHGEHGKFILRDCGYQNGSLHASYTTVGNDSGTDSGSVVLRAK